MEKIKANYYENIDLKGVRKLAEFTESYMDADFIFQINKNFSEDERFLLAFFTEINKLLKAKSKLLKL
ncbi:MAG: hypothetical protein HWN66_01865 [Candidatus Helarchaeota archaeon]|nr:hypothetical protein [Candidatus Helarchaeota archaeon]